MACPCFPGKTSHPDALAFINANEHQPPDMLAPSQHGAKRKRRPGAVGRSGWVVSSAAAAGPASGLRLQSPCSTMPTHQTIVEALTLIFEGIARLKKAFPNREFTIDGRLVGDIGEVIAALEYDVVLDKVCQPDHDATAPNGRRLQIKATFKGLAHVQDHLRSTTSASNCLLTGDTKKFSTAPAGSSMSASRHRKGIGVQLLSFPNKDLKALSREVPAHERIPKNAKL